MPKIHADGVEIDATFSVERLASDTFSIYLASRSGGKKRSNARNTQYTQGLELLLQRLADMDATIMGVVLAPTGQDELTEVRLSNRPYPWIMRNVLSIHELTMGLGRAQSATNRQPRAKGVGNNTKRIRIDCRVNRFSNVQTLERALEEGFQIQQSPEVQDALQVVAEIAGRSSGRRFQQSPATRRAVEECAMKRAVGHYEERGWLVDSSVAKNNCFDLLCCRGSEILHVEVKGTSGPGKEVLLTRNEVVHAREFPHVALVVVSGIVVSGETEPTAAGGDLSVFDPWGLDESQLEPLAFSYSVP